MPQMMPLPWNFYFIMFMIISLLMMILMFYSKLNLKSKLIDNKKVKKNWKW